mgnify:CR=1 FL=1
MAICVPLVAAGWSPAAGRGRDTCMVNKNRFTGKVTGFEFILRHHSLAKKGERVFGKIRRSWVPKHSCSSVAVGKSYGHTCLSSSASSPFSNYPELLRYGEIDAYVVVLK